MLFSVFGISFPLGQRNSYFQRERDCVCTYFLFDSDLYEPVITALPVVFVLALCCQINYCEVLSLLHSRALISSQDVRVIGFLALFLFLHSRLSIQNLLLAGRKYCV